MNQLDVYGRSVQIIAWIFGISPIEYPIGRQRSIISLLYLMFLMGSFGWIVKSFMDLDEFNSSVLTWIKKIFLAMYFGTIGYSYYVLISRWLFRKEESECLNRLNEVTESIASISSDIDFKIPLRNTMIQILFWAFCAQDVFWFFKYNDLGLFNSFVKISTRVYPRILGLYTSLMFVNYLRIIELNFAKINSKLKELSAFTDCSSSMSIYEIVKIICRIKKLHLRLTRVSKSLNDLYGVCIVDLITSNFIVTLFHLYNIYCIIYNNGFVLTTLSYALIINCLWICFHLYVTMTVIDVCSLTVMEANKTGCRIFELSNSGSSMEIDKEARISYMKYPNLIEIFFHKFWACLSWSPLIVSEPIEAKLGPGRALVELFSTQLLQIPLEITAHDFCVVDRTLTFNIIMALISYLMFLVQMSACEP